MADSKRKKRNNNRNNKNKVKRTQRAQKSGQEEIVAEEQATDTTVDCELEHKPARRSYSDDETGAEVQPKPKKKKKQIVHTESTDKKGKKSIRQMKREKHAQRMAEEAAASKDQLKSQCINYLSQWKYDRQNWKFMKVKQVWLYKNKFSSNLLPDSSWPVFLDYFESAKGNIRKLLLEDANKVIKAMDEWTESQNIDHSSTKDHNVDSELAKPDDIAYKRARDLIQCLEE